MIQCSCNLVGKLSAKGSLAGKLNNAVIKEYPELEDLEVTPSTEQQSFKSNKYGYDNVIVKRIESNELTVTPSMDKQVFNNLYNKVTVEGVDKTLITLPLEFEISNVGDLVEISLTGNNRAVLKDDKTIVIDVIEQNKVNIIETKHEHTELSYIQSTGTQYIKTDIIPINHKVEVKFRYITAKDNTALFGSTSTTYHLTWYANKWYYACGNSEKNVSSISCTTLQTVIFNNDNKKISFNGTEYGSTNGTSSATNVMSIFARTSFNNSTPCIARIYYFKIYDNSTGALVRDFIPVKDSYGVICLYDKITHKYFYNSGPGSFSGG